MSQDLNSSQARVRAAIGATTRHQQDNPPTKQQTANMQQMLYAANEPISTQNWRVLSLLVAAKVQAAYFAKDPKTNYTSDRVLDTMHNIFALLVYHLRTMRKDLTLDVLYAPQDQLWLFESNFNDRVSKLVQQSLQQLSEEQRGSDGLLSSGQYPNRALLNTATAAAFKLRDSRRDLPDAVFNQRAPVPSTDDPRDIPAKSHFTMSESELWDQACQECFDGHDAELALWEELLETHVFQKPIEEKNFSTREWELIENFRWQSRAARLRRLKADESEMNFWEIMSAGMYMHDPFNPYLFDNVYLEKPLKELFVGLNAESKEQAGGSSNKTPIYSLKKIRKAAAKACDDRADRTQGAKDSTFDEQQTRKIEYCQLMKQTNELKACVQQMHKAKEAGGKAEEGDGEAKTPSELAEMISKLDLQFCMLGPNGMEDIDGASDIDWSTFKFE